MVIKRLSLGSSDLRVTEVGIGSIPFQRLDTSEAVRLVNYGLDRGVNFIDSARGYGASEERIGRAIKGRRQEVVLASKSPARDAADMREALETSLRLLGVECIDLYQIHNASNDEAYEKAIGSGGALEALVAACEAGMVREIGLTSHSLDVALRAAESGHFSTIMYPLNFVAMEAVDRLIPLCQERGIVFIAMKPMAGGLLDRADLALGYLGQFPDAIKLVGIQKTDEIDEIVGLAERGFPLSPEAHVEMAQMRKELGTSFCRRCGYCLPCPEGINISSALSFAAMWRRVNVEKIIDRERDNMERARSCTACEECVARCPYTLPIPDLIREQLAFYESVVADYS